MYIIYLEWREKHPDLQRERNLSNAKKAQHLKTIKQSFVKIDKFDPSLFL